MDMCTRFDLNSLSRAFSNQCISVNKLLLSRNASVISRSGSPYDASHLSSYVMKLYSLGI